MKASQRSYGRIDYMPRLKVWRAVWYTSRDLELGRYPTYQQAADALQLAISSKLRSGIRRTS